MMRHQHAWQFVSMKACLNVHMTACTLAIVQTAQLSLSAQARAWEGVVDDLHETLSVLARCQVCEEVPFSQLNDADQHEGGTQIQHRHKDIGLER
jgi:hypothetical protein